MKLFTIKRQWYTPTATIGQLISPDGKELCYTLEDTCRAFGVKVKGSTAIPVSSTIAYKVEVNLSNRFGKELPIIYTEKSGGEYLLKSAGIQFSAIRMHGGNSERDTEGCILVASQFDGKDKIFNRVDDTVTAMFKEILKTDSIGLMVKNLPNKLL